MLTFPNFHVNLHPLTAKFLPRHKCRGFLSQIFMNYPDGGWFEEVDIDICPQCFKNTLIPFLKEKGVKIEKNEVDF
jgi:hypothetical protein